MPPATGAEGEPGAALITTLPDAGEIHPDVFVTVKVYVPAASPVMVQLVPVPLVVVPPGVPVRFQIPVTGKPLNITLPVDTAHVGCVMVPSTGAEGETFTVISDALGLLVKTGLLDITLILYCVPFVVPDGMIALITPDCLDLKVPIIMGEEKLPEGLLS